MRWGTAVSSIAALAAFAVGQTPEEILEAYLYLEAEDIRDAIKYAAFLADERVIEFVS